MSVFLSRTHLAIIGSTSGSSALTGELTADNEFAGLTRLFVDGISNNGRHHRTHEANSHYHDNFFALVARGFYQGLDTLEFAVIFGLFGDRKLFPCGTYRVITHGSHLVCQSILTYGIAILSANTSRKFTSKYGCIKFFPDVATTAVVCSNPEGVSTCIWVTEVIQFYCALEAYFASVFPESTWQSAGG
jgi:hypothetical protein